MMSNEPEIIYKKSKEPEILYIKASERKTVEQLVAKHSPLYKKLENKHIFILSMILGFYNNKRSELGSKPWNIIRTSYLNPEEESLIKAIAIATENNLSVLIDKKKVYSIAQEYATGGIIYLKEKVFGKYFGNFNKVIESDLIEEFEKINKFKINEEKK